MFESLHAVGEAEARGDANGALDIMGAHPVGSDGRVFWNPSRVTRLLQIVQLGPLLPGWATSRWILDQSLVRLDPAMHAAHRHAHDIAAELRGGDRNLPGVDRIDALAKVADHDWVYQQLVLYELGGIERFLVAGATPDLIAGADRIHEWAEAPMRGLRLDGRGSGTLLWADLATGGSLETMDIGAAVLMQVGDCVLGRIVPTESGPMFDGVPLGVPEAIATAAAADPGSWVDSLRDIAGTEDYFPEVVRGSFLLTDVPSPLSTMALVDHVPRSRGRDLTSEDLVDAVLGLARAIGRGTTSPDHELLDPWPCLAAEMLMPGRPAELAERITGRDADWLDVLSARLAGPAAEICAVLRRDLAGAA